MTQCLHLEEVLSGFSERMTGILPRDKIDEALAALKNTTNHYPASGGVMGHIFYQRWGLVLAPGSFGSGPFFFEDSGGIAALGGGNLIGDVYTRDLQKLTAETVSFEYNAAAVYTSLLFFDGNSQLLGHFQGTSSCSTLSGIGGGTGAWNASMGHRG